MGEASREGSAGPVRAVVVMGVSGSGKSLIGRMVAERLGGDFEDGDDHHPAANVAKMAAGRALTDADRGPWLAVLRGLIEQRLDDGALPPLVLACSALKGGYRGELAKPGEAVWFVFLEVERGTLERRLAARAGHFFDPKLLDDQLATLEVPGEGEALRVGEGEPEAMVGVILRGLG
ncbi:MAG: gluconokinase [Planctomycetota bacterium]